MTTPMPQIDRLRALVTALEEQDIPDLTAQRDAPGWTARERRALDRAIDVHKRAAEQMRRTLDNYPENTRPA